MLLSKTPMRPMRPMRPPLLSLLLPIMLLCSRAEENSVRDTPSAGFETSDAVDQLSFEPPFVGDDLENVDWDFGGDTIVDINNYARLTSDRPSQVGWIWSKNTLKMDNWEVTLKYKLYGEASHLIGDGMALWIVENKYTEGPAMGMMQRFKGFALFVDTYDNGRNGFVYPRIAGFFSNGDLEYNKDTDGKGQEIGSCEVDVYKRPHATKLRIGYTKANGVTVSTTDGSVTDSSEEWKICFSSNKATISRDSHIGVTGVTGGLSAVHEVLAITAIITEVSPAPRLHHCTPK